MDHLVSLELNILDIRTIPGHVTRLIYRYRHSVSSFGEWVVPSISSSPYLTIGKQRGTLRRRSREDPSRIGCSWGYVLFQGRVIKHSSLSGQTKHCKRTQK